MQKTHSLTRIASAAVAAWRFVNIAGAHATSPSEAIGISEQAAAANKAFSAVTGYSCWVEAAEAISEGDWVRPAADGTGRAARGAGGDACGRALGSAAVGKLVEVRFLEAGAVSGGGNSAGLSAVSYDGSGRVTSYTLNDIDYVLSGWGTSTVTVTGSDGSVRTISLDGSGRIAGVV